MSNRADVFDRLMEDGTPIVFNNQKEFEDAVIGVILDKLDIQVRADGYPFMTGVAVYLVNNVDKVGSFIGGSDAVA